MGSAAATEGAKKRHGQPARGTDKSRMIQREKNREAQQAFRQRRQAAQAAQCRRIQRLEETIEEIAHVFTGFFDEVLQTEAIATQHPTLLRSLRRSLARMLTLTEEVNSPDDGLVPAADRNSQYRLDEETIAGSISDGIHAPVLPSSHNANERIPETLSASIDSDPPRHVGPGSFTAYPTTRPDFSEASLAAAHPLSPMLQVYGTWFSASTPPLQADDPFELPSPHIQEALQALGSFPLRLLETTLSYGYVTLVNRVPGELHPAFETTLRFRTPEELVARFRWLLGPGKDYIYRASGITWGINGGTGAVLPPHMLSSTENSLCSESEPHKSDGSKAPSEYLTVIGVYRHLQSLGATMINAETMEVQLNDSQLVDVGQGPTINPTRAPSPPTAWSYIDFFSMHSLESAPSTLRLNVSLLTQNLARVATCFSRGPGYPKCELSRVMKASAATIQGF